MDGWLLSGFVNCLASDDSCVCCLSRLGSFCWKGSMCHQSRRVQGTGCRCFVCALGEQQSDTACMDSQQGGR